MRAGRRLCPHALILAVLAAASLAAPTPTPAGPPLSPPSPAHPLGLDPLGRDAALVLLRGVAPTLEAAAAAALIVLAAGALAAYAAGLGARPARLASRTAAALPKAALIAALGAAYTLTPLHVGLLIGAFSAVEALNPLLSDAEAARRSPAVEAAEAIGAGRAWVATRYILPAIAPRVARYASLAAAAAIVATAGLSMTGLLPANTYTIGTLAYLIQVTPGAVATEAGQAQLAGFAAATTALAYLTHRLATCAADEHTL